MSGNVEEALADAVFRELEDGLLGAAQHLLGFVGVLDGLGDGVLRNVDQAAQQRLVADDANVMLDRRPLGYAVDQRREIRDAADGFDLFAPVKLFDQRDHVDRAAGLLQIAHAGVNAAMRVQREVVAGEMFGSLIVERVVEQDGAQDRPLRFHADGKSALETVIGGCHRSSIHLDIEREAWSMSNGVNAATKPISFEKLWAAVQDEIALQICRHSRTACVSLEFCGSS